MSTDGVNVFEYAENDVRANIRKSVDEYVKTKKHKLSEAEKEEIVRAVMTPNFSGFPSDSISKKVFDEVIIKYKTKFRTYPTNHTIYNGISDVYGGFTSNQLSGTYGHWDNDYWTDSSGNYNGNQGKELFAHTFASYMTSKDDCAEELEEYFPNATDHIKDFFEFLKGR